MKEIVRRLVLAFGLFSGLWLICSSPSELYSIKPVDWKEKIGQPKDDSAPPSQAKLEEAMQKESKGTMIVKEGPRWAGLFNGIAQTLAGEPPTSAWAARRGREYYGETLFFSPTEAPLNELDSVLGPENAFASVQIKSGTTSQYLGITRRYASDISHYAPLHLAYPKRFQGFLVLLLTALLYSLIPWPKHGVEAVRYSRSRSSVVPDVLGCALSGLFFCLPLLITNENGGGYGIFSEGWIYVTAGMWLMALLGVSLWIVSAWYEGLLLELRPDALRCKTIWKDELIPLHQIESIGISRIDNAKLNRALVILSIFVSWKALGPALLASGPEYGLRLKLMGGRILTFPLKAALGFPQMIGRLMNLGVPILESVFEGFEARRNAPELKEPFPPLGSGIGHAAASILFTVPLAYLTFVNLPGPVLAIRASDLSDVPFTSSKAKEWAPSHALMDKEEQIRKEMEKLQGRMKELEEVARTGSSQKRASALEESEECLNKIMKLSEEVDSLRKKDGAPD